MTPSIKHKRGTAANLADVDPVLAAGELCIETDTRKFKFGDGVNVWSSLAYATTPPNQIFSLGNLVQLTSEQQAAIEKGTLVTTTDGRRWVYTGTGSKVLSASYVELADITPEWTAIANKPATFAQEWLVPTFDGSNQFQAVSGQHYQILPLAIIPTGGSPTFLDPATGASGDFYVVRLLSRRPIYVGGVLYEEPGLIIIRYFQPSFIGGGSWVTATTAFNQLYSRMTITGANSAGVSLDNQSRTLAQSNTLAIMGGNVGIGTLTPTTALDVTGNLNVSGTITPGTSYDLVGASNISVAADGTAGTITVGMYPAGLNNQVQYNSNNVLAASSNFTFDGSVATISGQFNIDNLRLDGNTLSPTNSNGAVIVNWAGTGYVSIGDSTMSITGQRSVGMNLDSTARTLAQNNTMAVMGGKVGIGTLTPVDVLDVNGNVFFRNTTNTFGRAYFPSPVNDTYAYVGSDASGHATLTSGSCTVSAQGQAGKVVIRASSVGVDIGSIYSNTVYVSTTLGTSTTERCRTTTSAQYFTCSGNFANAGDARTGVYNIRNTTTDATVTNLLLNPATATSKIPIAATTVAQFDIKLAAYNTTDNTGAAWTIRGAIRRDATTSIALLGSTTTEGWADAGMTATSVAVTADATNYGLNVAVTGIAGKTIRWHAAVVTSEVSFGSPNVT